MKVFISWSGPLSERIATILREWLPDVLQQVDPFMSTEDIRKGNRWQSEIADQLNETSHGIACLTASNLSSEWLLFETGALSKVLENSMTWTLLIGDLEQAQVSGPLAQFQHTSLNKRADFKRLVEDINDSLKSPLQKGRLNRIFERNWPELKSKVQTALERQHEPKKQGPRRTDAELLRELIDLSRETSRTVIGISDKLSRQAPANNRRYIWSLTIAMQTASVNESRKQRFAGFMSDMSDQIDAPLETHWNSGIGGVTELSVGSTDRVSKEEAEEIWHVAKHTGFDLIGRSSPERHFDI